MSRDLKYNGSGVRDYVAEKAIVEADRLPLHVAEVIKGMKMILDSCGFEVIGRIPLRDKKTGKEYR